MSQGGLLARTVRGLRFHGPGLAVVLVVAFAPFTLAALRGAELVHAIPARPDARGPGLRLYAVR
jgi:hypothetical protein